MERRGAYLEPVPHPRRERQRAVLEDPRILKRQIARGVLVQYRDRVNRRRIWVTPLVLADLLQGDWRAGNR